MMQDRRGAVLIIYALCFSVLLAFTGLAIDAARAWIVRSRLQTAVDSAALLGAREENITTMQSDATKLFTTNFNANAPIGGLNIMGASVTNISVTLNTSTQVVVVSASATVDTTFLKVFPWAPSTLLVTATATSQAVGAGLEIALVLDNTGSMGQTDPSTGGTKLQALQTSVSDLLNSLYGSQNDTVSNLWVSVVPFVTTINIGNGTKQSNWLQYSYSNSDYYHNNGTQYSWSGCVLARIDGGTNDDETEVSPISHQFQPYYADDTYGIYKRSNNGCSRDVAYRNGICMGDNDWGAPAGISTRGNPALGAGLTFGPNRGCPVPLLPLTSSKSTIMTMINNLNVAYSGTVIGLGLQGGWFTISPDWRGSNGWGNSVLPHNYMSQSPAPNPPIQKVVVLVSDGDDTWGYINDVAPGDIKIPTSIYMPYGRLSSSNNPLDIYIGNNYNTLESNAVSELDARWQAVCSNMKAQGIIIYVIGLGVSDSNARSLLQNCSSGAKNYYVESPSAATLDAAFKSIAAQLSTLRLVH